MKTEIVNLSPDLKRFITTRQINKMLKDVILSLNSKKIRNKDKLNIKFITVVFIGTAEMKALNTQFRQKNYATDVLSFSPLEPESLGELVFCVDVLKKQAKRNEHTFASEFLYLLIHGVLHLLGYDHELSVHEEKLMFKIQDDVFEKLV